MFMNARFDTTPWLPREGEAIWDYWLSLSPMAPVFGVPWRFGDVQVIPARKPKPVASKAKSLIKPEAEEAELIAARTPPELVEEPVAETVVVTAPETVAETVVEPVAEVGAVTETVAETVAEVEADAAAAHDDLTMIRGVGPKMAEKLRAAGVTSFAQIAAWDPATVAQMDAALGGLPGAIARADWVGQAKSLA